MDELKDKGKKVMSEVKGDIITKWEEKSRDFIETFLLLFGRDRLTNMWDKSKGRILQALSPTGSPNGSVNGDEEIGEFDDDDDDDDDYYLGTAVPNQVPQLSFESGADGIGSNIRVGSAAVAAAAASSVGSAGSVEHESSEDERRSQ